MSEKATKRKKRQPRRKCLVCTHTLTKKNVARSNPYFCDDCFSGRTAGVKQDAR